MGCLPNRQFAGIINRDSCSTSNLTASHSPNTIMSEGMIRHLSSGIIWYHNVSLGIYDFIIRYHPVSSGICHQVSSGITRYHQVFIIRYHPVSQGIYYQVSFCITSYHQVFIIRYYPVSQGVIRYLSSGTIWYH